MGCVVNGPGESKSADIGISLPGSGESPKAPIFIDGDKIKQQLVYDYCVSNSLPMKIHVICTAYEPGHVWQKKGQGAPMH